MVQVFIIKILKSASKNKAVEFISEVIDPIGIVGLRL